MATSLQFALSNPTEGMEEEFNQWYAGPHLLHGIETPGIFGAQRFKRQSAPWPSGKHDYLMIWEMDDPAFALAELAKVKGTEAMPISPSIDMATVQPPTMWRRAEVRSSARYPAPSHSRGSVILAMYNARDDDHDALANSLLDGGLHILADKAGVLSAQYLTLADEQIRGNARKFPHALLVEVQDESAAVAALAEPLATLDKSDPDRWFAALFRPMGPRITPTGHREILP